MCVSVWNRFLVQISIWDCELDFDFGFGLGIRILLTWDSDLGIWDLELCFGEFVACVSELLITSFQECPRQNKVWRSEALGMNYVMRRFWLTFLAHPATLHFCFCLVCSYFWFGFKMLLWCWIRVKQMSK